MKQRLQKVRIEDFNTAALRRAAREGRLYIVPAAEYTTTIEDEVLRYMSRIDGHAMPPYGRHIGEMWKRIVSHPLLMPLLPSRREAFNKYAVTAIAVYLYEIGVYAFDSATAMHLCLEGVVQRNKYYKNAAYYAPSGETLRALRAIVREASTV